jgi:cystathionine beta-lyase/cystathionine gamma-synthase
MLDLLTMLAHDEINDLEHPVVPPIHQTSLFTFSSYAEMEAAFRGELDRAIYSRGHNPTVAAFETKVAALEGAGAARATASGMGAISLAVIANVSQGDRIVCVRQCYPDAFKLFTRLLPRFGVQVDFVDGSDTPAFCKALEGAKLAYLESPTSLYFSLQDLGVISQAAQANGVTTIIDNSWATPIYQQPLRHGIDLVVHSASKYLGGHSDVVAGVVLGSKERIAKLNNLEYGVLGAKLSPFEGFLLLRGLRTLPLRMAQQAKSALEVAGWLGAHSMVQAVHHPALRAGEQGRLFETYFSGSSSLFSFELLGSRAHVRAFVDALRLFRLGVSWGGHESLVYPAAIGLDLPGDPNPNRVFGTTANLVRLHVGLEASHDLIDDLEQALRAAKDVN